MGILFFLFDWLVHWEGQDWEMVDQGMNEITFFFSWSYASQPEVLGRGGVVEFM